MSAKNVLSLGFLVCALTSSGCAMKFATNLERVGELGAAAGPPRSASEVRVFYAALPKGFEEGRDGTLRVQEGFQHRVIGLMTTRVLDNCCCDVGTPLSRELVLDALKEKAAAAGATAIVYAQSTLPSQNDTPPGCKALWAARDAAGTRASDKPSGLLLASGWAVVLAP